jgi:hypothetical protein
MQSPMIERRTFLKQTLAVAAATGVPLTSQANAVGGIVEMTAVDLASAIRSKQVSCKVVARVPTGAQRPCQHGWHSYYPRRTP